MASLWKRNNVEFCFETANRKRGQEIKAHDKAHNTSFNETGTN